MFEFYPPKNFTSLYNDCKLLERYLYISDIIDFCVLFHPMPILTCYVSLLIESSPEMLHELIKYIQILDKDIYKTWNSDANQKNKFMQWVQNETEETDGDEDSQIEISDEEQSIIYDKIL